MKVKTAELTGPALDWAVAVCEIYNAVNGRVIQANELVRRIDLEQLANYSTNWEQGGPLIDKYRPDLECPRDQDIDASIWLGSSNFARATGPTYLIAAMRAIVVSRFGGEIDIPEELCPTKS